MHNKTINNSFTSFGSITPQGNGLFPCTIKYWDLMDCTPTNPNPLYSITDHTDDDDYMDSHDDDEALEIYIPSRLAAFQLIRDLNNQVNLEINGYADTSKGIPAMAPADDATDDIFQATDLIYLIMHWDAQTPEHGETNE